MQKQKLQSHGYEWKKDEHKILYKEKKKESNRIMKLTKGRWIEANLKEKEEGRKTKIQKANSVKIEIRTKARKIC